MSIDTALAKEVEAVLKAKSTVQDRPTDNDLLPVYRYLVPQSEHSSSSSSSAVHQHETHWYCPKAVSSLHKEAATYLIFLFAFQRQGTSKAWVDRLEGVLLHCEDCARAFGAARRTLGSRYLSNWPANVRKNFFGAVDEWQAALVVSEAEKVSQPGYGGTASSTPALYSFSRAAVQLLLGEPSLLADSDIESLFNTAIASSMKPPLSFTSRGLTPSLIRLLSSPDTAHRQWAMSQLPAAARRPLSFAEWGSIGIGHEFQDLISGNTELEEGERWQIVETIVKEKVLDTETVQKGLLEGKLDDELCIKTGRGFMSVLSGLLGSDVSYYPSVLSCFAAVLQISPTRHIWSYDNSPDLPHTLLSELRNNPALQRLLEDRYLADLSATNLSRTEGLAQSDKEKGKKKELDGPLDWISDFLLSLVDTEQEIPVTDKSSTSGFAEALAVATNFTFQELQHGRLSGELRAAAAFAGFEALTRVHHALRTDDTTLQSALASTLDLHSTFITTVALRPKNHPLPTWAGSRVSARELLVTFFHADADSINQSLLYMAQVSHAERKRQQRKKRSKVEVPSAISIDRLPQATIKKDLWAMAYDALSPSDAEGTAIILEAMAPFSQVELLDRQGSWTHQGLEEVVKKEDWVACVRAINSSVKATRESFPRAIESLAMQADPVIVKSVWLQPGVPKAVTILLLSPDDEVHAPIITLLQQSFDDVDDRGDCFRALLKHYPDKAMDGLTEFLRTFIQAAAITPESCSLAKWLVRCFHDVLEALCRPSGASEALLQTDEFLTFDADGRSMAKRLEELWHLMTTSLALIFKRTLDWAPHFENEVMVDWMRDALIFGRQMTDHIRAFEAAVLGQSSARFQDGVPDSPLKTTSVGKKMTKQLEMVLRDLILWLRLTDVETLFQTHQLIKTILGRISRLSPDLTKNHELEKTLLEIDKFCRKASRSYTSRLTNDLLAELSELLAPFDLPDAADEVQFVKEVSKTPQDSIDDRGKIASKAPPSGQSKPVVRNAFAEMMKASGGKTPTPIAKSKMTSRPPKVIDVDDYDNDDFLSNLSEADLDIIERRAKITTETARPGVATKPAVPSRLVTTARPQLPSNRLHVNLVPKPTPKPPGGTSFTSKIMKDLRKEHQAAIQERRRSEIGGIVPKLPAASALGSGLGAYTGPQRPRVVEPVDSGSSASDSSDEENRAMKTLLAKQKSPAKPVRPVEKRTIKVLGSSMADIMRRNDDRRANAHATKQRLKPDLNPLYRYVLSWNPDHAGPLAPHAAKYAADLSSMRPVLTTFDSSKQYEQVMLPLYLQELWSQCGKESSASNGPAVSVEVSSRQYEDDFVEIDLIVMGPMDFFVNDTDVVTLRQPGNPNALFAKVQAFRRKPKDTTLKVRILSAMDQRQLGGRAKWQMRKHLSLSTAIREFAALKGLPYYEPSLLRDVLTGRSAVMPQLALNDIEEAIKSYQVNEPQAKAILGAMHVNGFALIQGPPGTGKTKTISGLVGKWMSDRRLPMSVDGQPPVKPKLLVCAPSNAAIDEVVKRLILGVPSSSGIRLNPTIVRIGIDSSVNIAVKDVSLDSLVEARVNAESNAKDGGGEYARVQAELDAVKQQIKDKQEEIRLVRNNDEKRKVVENEYHALVTKRTQLGQASSKAKDAARDATRHLDGARRTARDIILKEADIVCATLSGAGHDTLAAHAFETVIIDEAAQAIEMSCLIPLKYGCKRCIMVGDPNQLPPTTFSTEAEKYSYNQSLFVRMTRHKSSQVQLLSIQYRMHPFISELPSKVFYSGQLKDGPDMARKTAAIWHQRNVFGPYRFFNVEGTEIKAGTSTKNPDEALAAVDLYRRLNTDFGTKINLAMRVGVISMYKEQLWELKRKFTEAFGPSILELIEFNTVDGFQGQEKDIIILSCVRSGPNLRQIGFLKDVRRMNVALTRAKSSLFVFGNGPTLERSDERWKIIVGDARERGFFVNYTSTTFGPGAIESPPPKKKKKEIVMSPKATKSVTGNLAQPSPQGLLPPKALAAEMSIAALKRKPSIEPIRLEKKRRVPDVSTASPSSSTDPLPNGAGLRKSPTGPRSMDVSGATKQYTEVADSVPAPVAVVPRLAQSANGAAKSITKPPQPRALPPLGPPSRPPPPPAAPPRPPEDVLFIKKKKKPNRPGAESSSGNAPASNFHAALKDRYVGRPGPGRS
ncbi:hypothetical protein IAR55_002157 [Kwoniella newhampshirensis]|uniref:Senataxin n=1 Tax=Kwoniella newhampshirensis TaxID=1651941 RepID=A0AAW0Z114_9TREE